MLLHNRDLSEYVIPQGSFDKSFNYHKQSLRNYKNIRTARENKDKLQNMLSQQVTVTKYYSNI